MTTDDAPAVLADAELLRVVGALGSGAVHLVLPADDPATRVREAVLADPLEVPALSGRELVLAVGIDAASDAATDIVRASGAAGAAGVAIKSEHDLPDTLLAAAETARIALLLVHPDVAWAQLYDMISAAIAVESATRSARAPASDLFGIANDIAAAAGGAVIIQGRGAGLLAYSNLQHEIDDARRDVILRRGLSETAARRQSEEGVTKRIYSAHDVIHLDGDVSAGRRPRLVMPVRAGDAALGSITVLEGDTPLGAAAETALRNAAPVVALQLARQRVSRDPERQRRRELLHDLLERKDGPSWIAAELGVAEDTRCAIVAFECSSEAIRDSTERANALELISRSCELLRPTGLCLPTAKATYALVLGTDAEQLPLARFATDIVERTRRPLGSTVRAAIGSVVARLGDAGRSRAEADQVLHVLDGRPQPVVADIETVRHLVILDELRELARDRTDLMTGRLAVLQEHDARMGTAYVETLRAYLDNFGDVPACAAKLNIHPNTLRYRIRRTVALSGLDLNDAEQRLVVALQMRLLPQPQRPSK